MASWLEQAAWRLRPSLFRDVRAFDDGRPIVVMALDPGERLEEWLWLRQLWLDLPAHPQILDAIDRGPGSSLLVRYAAVAWRHAPVSLETAQGRQLVATWGAQITSAFRTILADVPEPGHFLRPHVMIDLVNDARLAFLPVTPAELPADVQATWPHCDERAMMSVIARAIVELCTELEHPAAEPIRTIVERCRERRYRTLEDLQTAWIPTALADLDGDRRRAWELTQEGVGWLELGRPHPALPSFVAALELNPRLGLALEGHERTRDLLGLRRRLPAPDVGISWADIAARGQELEDARAFREAIALYARARLDGTNDVALHLARARCHLALGDDGHAIDYARRALALEPVNRAAHAVLTRGHLLAHQLADALQRAVEWIALAPTDADAHHARGRALLGLGHLVDARDAFDRACELRPQMLEAMLLRREVDRVMRRTVEQAGRQKAIEIAVPAHLAELRDALVAGRVHDALAVLERPAYDTDAVAKLVQAECLAYDRRYGDAIAIYDRAAELAPEQRARAVMGKARALLALDRGVEAVAALDSLGEHADLELAELRGLIFQRLGLEREAEAELDRVVAAEEHRSDLRLGRR